MYEIQTFEGEMPKLNINLILTFVKRGNFTLIKD